MAFSSSLSAGTPNSSQIRLLSRPIVRLRPVHTAIQRDTAIQTWRKPTSRRIALTKPDIPCRTTCSMMPRLKSIPCRTVWRPRLVAAGGNENRDGAVGQHDPRADCSPENSDRRQGDLDPISFLHKVIDASESLTAVSAFARRSETMWECADVSRMDTSVDC
jgi:hypothetical protein